MKRTLSFLGFDSPFDERDAQSLRTAAQDICQRAFRALMADIPDEPAGDDNLFYMLDAYVKRRVTWYGLALVEVNAAQRGIDILYRVVYEDRSVDCTDIAEVESLCRDGGQLVYVRLTFTYNDLDKDLLEFLPDRAIPGVPLFAMATLYRYTDEYLCAMGGSVVELARDMAGQQALKLMDE